MSIPETLVLQAYIGPGAGITFLGSFLVLFAAMGLLLLSVLTWTIHDERERMLFDSLRRMQRGLTVCVFDGPDRIQHMFWRHNETKNNRGGSGTTGVAGAFTVMDLTQNLPGLAPGKYTVAFSRMRLPDGSAAPELEAGQPVDPGMIRVETLPTHLLNPDPRETSNIVEISKDDITDLELKISTE